MIPGSRQVNMEFLQADGLHPNTAGVDVLVQEIGPAILALAQLVE